MRIRVIGIGSGNGDDSAGLRVTEALVRTGALPPDVAVATCERPLDLVDLLAETDAVLLVDATRSGRRPGTLHRPDPAALRDGTRFSSHALGVGEALRLAEALGRRPVRLELVGIEAGPIEGTQLSPAVRSALEPACEQVRRLVVELRQARETVLRSPACTKPDSVSP